MDEGGDSDVCACCSARQVITFLKGQISPLPPSRSSKGVTGLATVVMTKMPRAMAKECFIAGSANNIRVSSSCASEQLTRLEAFELQVWR